jgi:uncharacterized protein YjbI with pentapeptide repeats
LILLDFSDLDETDDVSETRSMARKKRKTPAVAWDQPRYVGKTFAFGGRWSGWDGRNARQLVEAEEGEVVSEVTPKLDFLAIGLVSGKTTLLGAKAEKLNAAGEANIRILTMTEFCDLFTPDRALAEALLRAGPVAAARWRLLRGRARASIDLSGVDLRGVQFPPVWLHNVNFEGADLRKADLKGCHLNEVVGAQLDGASLSGSVKKITNCQLIGADLSGVCTSNFVLERCNCTKAKLEKASLRNLQAAEVLFHQARMSRATLTNAKLARAILTEADLSKANLAECDLSGANLSGADLSEADLSKAMLKGADLRNARLRGAVLTDADLTDAQIEGADLEGAYLAGAKLDGLDLSKARGLAATPAAPTAGPHLLELDRVVGQTVGLKSKASIVLADRTSIPVWVSANNKGNLLRTESPRHRQYQRITAVTLSGALLDVVRPYLHGSLQLDSIKTTATGSPLKSRQLQRLLLAAWCEACGRPVPAEDKVKAEVLADRDRDQLRLDALAAELRKGAKAVASWNARTHPERKLAGPFQGFDLSEAKLAGVNFRYLEFLDANFEKTSLVGANLGVGRFSRACFRDAKLDRADMGHSHFTSANFENAILREANLRRSNCRAGCFQGADLTDANLTEANLCGADLSTATLTNVNLNAAEFDAKTQFPQDFAPPRSMRWKGVGANDPRNSPGKQSQPLTAQSVLPNIADLTSAALTLDQFMQRLRGKVDPGRLANALTMLRAERFQLFSQVAEDALVGVVKSQSSDSRVYSCRLANDGAFSCCTQNLRICGGLGGAICKHLLVLIVGLAKAGQINLASVDQAIAASRSQRPIMDKDAASAVFLRYKGAEAGELDWRPTETIPEDYYAF